MKDAYEAGLLTKTEYDTKRLAIIDGQLLAKRCLAVLPRLSLLTFLRSPPASPRMTERPSSSPRSASPPAARKNTGSATPPHELGSSPVESMSPRARPKFDVSQPYDPANQKRGYKEDHQRAAVPMPPKGVVGQRIEMPAALREFTGIKVVQEPENPKVGVYLGPKGSAGVGGVYASQYDVRKKLAIGAPEVSTNALIGSAAAKVSTVTIHTAGAASFEERVFANTNVLDLISACVRRLEVLHPASFFGMIQKRGTSEVWISPDVLASELSTGGQLVVVPKQAAPEDVKKAYMAKVLRQPVPYTVEMDGPTIDVATAPNEGKQFYKQYDL